VREKRVSSEKEKVVREERWVRSDGEKGE